MIIVILVGFASYNGTFAWINASIDENALNADLTVGRMFSIEGELGSNYSMGNKKIMVPGENLIVRPLGEDATTAADAGESETSVVEDGYEPCKLSIKSDSTIETQLRVKIDYSYLEYNTSTNEVDIIGSDPLCNYGNTNTLKPTDPNHRLQVAFSDSEPGKWVYNSNDGFWYYNPTGASSTDDDYLIIPPTYEEETTTAAQEEETTPGGGEPETTTEPETTARPETEIALIDYIRYDPDYYTGNNATENQFYKEVWAGREVQVRLTVQAKQARYVDWGTLAEQVADFGA